MGRKEGRKNSGENPKGQARESSQTAHGREGKHDCAPSPMKARQGQMQATWGRDRSPTPLTQWEGGKGQQAQARESFIMGEGHVTNLEEGGQRNPEVLS